LLSDAICVMLRAEIETNWEFFVARDWIAHTQYNRDTDTEILRNCIHIFLEISVNASTYVC